MATHLQEGDKAPAFTGRDQDGNKVTLAQFKGKKLVLYFYPEDDTPTCTVQACILIDNIVQGNQWKFAVVGVGMNINQTGFEAFSRKAVSLKQVTGQHYSIPEVAAELFAEVAAEYNALQQDPQNIVRRYHESLYRIGQTARLKKTARIFPAFIKGVTADGLLITGSDVEEHFAVGEVEWMD